MAKRKRLRYYDVGWKTESTKDDTEWFWSPEFNTKRQTEKFVDDLIAKHKGNDEVVEIEITWWNDDEDGEWIDKWYYDFEKKCWA